MAGKFDVEELERNWKWSEGDPEELFVLEEEIASGSFGSVYKVRLLLTSTSLSSCNHTLLCVIYHFGLTKCASQCYMDRKPHFMLAEVCPCVTIVFASKRAAFRNFTSKNTCTRSPSIKLHRIGSDKG
jgi:hypothetical protein